MNVVVFEEHHAVLAHWFERGHRNRTLVCFDAHLDLQRIGDARLDRLRQCTASDSMGALGKRHHLMPDAGSAYSIEDFLYAAHRLGIVEHLVWVAPDHVEIENSPETIEQLREMDGVTEECIDSARTESVGGRMLVRGQLLGLDLTICRLESLGSLELPQDLVIDVDLDYFISVPGDRLWLDPQTVAECIRRLPVDSEEVSISRSVESGFTPLKFRFLAEWLTAHLTDDSATLEQYRPVMHATLAVDEGQFREAWSLIGEGPFQTAAAYYLAAQLNASRHGQWLKCAATMDESYRPNPLRIACEYPARQIPIPPADVERLTRMADAEESSQPRDDDRRALTQAAIGVLWCQIGQLDRACESFHASRSLAGGCRELALAIGRSFSHSSEAERAIPYLTVALDDDKTRTAAMLLLGRIAYESGDLDSAAEYGREAMRRAPAWHLARELIAPTQR